MFSPTWNWRKCRWMVREIKIQFFHKIPSGWGGERSDSKCSAAEAEGDQTVSDWADHCFWWEIYDSRRNKSYRPFWLCYYQFGSMNKPTKIKQKKTHQKPKSKKLNETLNRLRKIHIFIYMAFSLHQRN